MSDQPTLNPAEVEQVLGRLLSDVAATAGLQMIHIGIRAGLWQAMADGAALTPAEVATRAAVVEPYVREWLKHQAVSGYVSHDPDTGRFSLPPAVAAVLADDVQSGVVDGFATMLMTMASDNALVERDLRAGHGVGWHQRSAEHWHGMDLVTRSAVVPALTSSWVPALDGVEPRLRAGASVAEVGCGYGAALIALAESYPESRFTGFDYHDGSIAHARKAAAAAGVADRVAFEVADAAGFTGVGYDLVLFIDTFHDLGDPLVALRRTRDALNGDGTVLLVEFLVGDRIEDNVTPMGRLMYASSALVCTPNALAQGATDPLGAAPGQARLAEIAAHAGFTRVRRLPVDTPINLLLELRP